MGSVEALYIFDEHNNAILEHVYAGRPPSSDTLLNQYLAQPAPRPSFTYLQNTNPPTLLSSIIHDRLIFLCPTSTETEPLLVLEFLHRLADALQDFLGSPLLATKLESSYDVVAQIVGEICDAGIVCNTEPNSLRDVVEAPNWVGSFLGGLGLPASSPANAGRTGSLASLSLSSSQNQNTESAIPWRRSNVRHTSNELYVDIIERLSVIYAPSGRPLSATAQGTIAFTSQISGVPDLILKLSCPGGKQGINYAMDLPTFHPCVRLSRWKDNPGELSFVPPDGRFVLAGYECNLLPDILQESKMSNPPLDLPAFIDVRTSLGDLGDGFEVILTRKSIVASVDNKTPPTSRSNSGLSRFAASNASGFNSTNTSSTTGPPLEKVTVSIPLPYEVRNISVLKPSRGEAHFIPTDSLIEWHISTKEASSIPSTGAVLRCTVVGPATGAEEEDTVHLRTDTYDYDAEETTSSYQSDTAEPSSRPSASRQQSSDARQMKANKLLMPRSAYLSFNVRGWLPSGIRVDSLNINTKTSKGLGAGVQPYKGVKYHTCSWEGIEVRC